MNRYYEVAAVREALHCPVPSVTPQFYRNGEIDWDATGRVIENMIAGGAGTLLVTYGDSLLTILTDQETLELNRFVAQVAGKRAMVIACSKIWTHPQMLAYAEKCREYGCDVVIPFYPDWAQSLDPEALIQCFREIGKIMPVMALTNMTNGRGIPKSVLKALSAEDGIVAVKDDMAHPYGKNILSFTRDKFAFLQGGRAFGYMDVEPFGADGYLSVYARVFPEVSNAFWKEYHGGNIRKAVELVEKYDCGFFSMAAENGMHFSAAIQGMTEAAGLGSRWRRAPYSSLTDQQMEVLKDFLRDRGLPSKTG